MKWMLLHGVEYHFKSAMQAFHLDTVQVPGASRAPECEHTFTSFLISRVGSTADFLFVSGLLPLTTFIVYYVYG